MENTALQSLEDFEVSSKNEFVTMPLTEALRFREFIWQPFETGWSCKSRILSWSSRNVLNMLFKCFLKNLLDMKKDVHTLLK